MRRETAPIGAPCWTDLFTADPDRSRAFYGEIFGWTAEDPRAEYGGYFNFSQDGVLVAGCMRNDGSTGAPDGWSVHLAVRDAAATFAAATSAGSQVIVPPMAVGPLGTMAQVTDPGGAAIGMWQPGEHKGFGMLDEPGAPSWFELHTREYDKSVQFYKDVFAWDAHTVSDSPEFRYTTYGESDQAPGALAGIMDASGFLPDGVPSYWAVYFFVDNADKTLAQVTDLGGSIVHPAEDTPYGRLATASDPTGAVFKLRQTQV